MRVQNGLWTRFWSDNWTPFGSLDVFLNSSLSRLGTRSEQRWPLSVGMGIGDFLLQDQNNNFNYKFSTGEVYTYLSGDAAQVGWAPLVWIKRGIPRQSFHVWLVAQNRLPARDRLLSWGIQTDHLCLLCNNHGESRNHMFQECDYSYELWRLITTRLGVQPKRTWEETTAQLLSLPSSSTHTRVTLLAWQAMTYWIWTERNSRLHTKNFKPVDSIFTSLDRQIRNKTQSFRNANPSSSSKMFQIRIRFT
ncbi:hypothetical protein F2Q68_00031554 [Brassica cretica]|uniref:Reverse transcriptase zinc-binding domain-containing protein n=1 Tax=Brassica cretica TaxID=69181 RepID=A0A8S9G906_BRACR|nr:hypothetical protein F2Q68_00031554 [Brassica cretica]